MNGGSFRPGYGAHAAVGYQTVDGTAAAGREYLPASGNVILPPNDCRADLPFGRRRRAQPMACVPSLRPRIAGSAGFQPARWAKPTEGAGWKPALPHEVLPARPLRRPGRRGATQAHCEGAGDRFARRRHLDVTITTTTSEPDAVFEGIIAWASSGRSGKCGPPTGAHVLLSSPSG